MIHNISRKWGLVIRIISWGPEAMAFFKSSTPYYYKNIYYVFYYFLINELINGVFSGSN